MNTEQVAQKVVELVRKQAWYEALDTLYSDRQKAKQMGVNARAKLQDFSFSWSHVVERIISAA